MLFFISIITYSQSDFRKGFIINNDGEKLSGFLNYKENSSVFDYCEFKTSLEATSKKYTPQLIKAYGFENDKYFISKEITTGSITETKFLEVIVSGIATLYKAEKFYYLQKDDVFKELENREIEYTSNSKNYRRASRKYVGILKVLLKDCELVKNKIDRTNYKERDLSKLIIEYNKCKGQKSIVYKEDKEWFKAEYGGSFGYSNSTMNYEHKSTKQLFFTTNSNPSTAISFGGHIELSSPRISENLSFFTGVFFSSNSFINSNQSASGNNNYLNEVTTQLKQTKIPFGIRYRMPFKFISPYFTIGGASATNISSQTHWVSETLTNSTVIIESKKFDISNISFGIYTSIGFEKEITKKLKGFIELVYENFSLNNSHTYTSSSAQLITEEYNSTVTHLQIQIGIRF